MRTSIQAFWLMVCLVLLSAPVSAASKRIVTLSPHLTEWVYLLEQQQHLIAVSAYSDFPAEATQLPVIADANGINFTQLVALEPTLILAWQGGNKPQDIARLQSMGYEIFLSSPQQLDDIGAELTALGELLSVAARASDITLDFKRGLAALRKQYQDDRSQAVFFYMWTKPLMSIGKNAWANKALQICGAHTIFADAPTDYPEVRLAEVLKRQPTALVTTMQGETSELQQFWQPHRPLLNVPLIQVDANILHRFTPRIIGEIQRLCEQLPRS